MRKIQVSDFTLRQLAEEERKDILFREKISVAASIDNFGADKIELAPVKSPREDAIIYKTIASVVKNACLAVPVGYTEESVNTAWECICTAKKPCLQVMLPVATAQMEYSFRAKEGSMLENIQSLVSLCAKKCDNVEFTAQDATRADRDFLIKACIAAKESGASCITLCDDAGVSFPEEIAQTVAAVKKECDLPLYVCLADRANMAIAGAVAAVRAGADGVKTSMVGDGVISTEKFAQTVSAKGTVLDICTRLKLTEIHSDIKNTAEHILMNAPTDGDSGAVGSTDNVFLDAESSFADVCRAISALGYELSDEDNGKVYRALAQICEKKHSVGAKELEALVASNAMQVPSTYHLTSYVANCSNIGSSMAQVSLDAGGDTLNGVATGDGPIDSAFRAIEQSLGHHYELDDFQVQAVTQGKEALGSALVRLRNNGKLYSGNGLSTDIVGASIRAYINALNKIVYEEG